MKKSAQGHSIAKVKDYTSLGLLFSNGFLPLFWTLPSRKPAIHNSLPKQAPVVGSRREKTGFLPWVFWACEHHTTTPSKPWPRRLPPVGLSESSGQPFQGTSSCFTQKITAAACQVVPLLGDLSSTCRAPQLSWNLNNLKTFPLFSQSRGWWPLPGIAVSKIWIAFLWLHFIANPTSEPCSGYVCLHMLKA